jgi:radical SAM protein with 4Fe4S-binding SPASM domain
MTTYKIYAAEPTEGLTRLCIDAWTKTVIQVDGTVKLCCYYTPVGNINDKSLIEILNDDEAKRYRKGLLTGDLMPMCHKCGDKKLVETHVLLDAVKSWYEHGKLPLL